jgi:hypothetical protein
MNHDLINTGFVIGGAIFMFLNCYRLYKDKQTAGFSLLSTLFFAAWNVWGVFLFLSLGLWISLTAQLFVVLAYVIWISQIVYYRRRGKHGLWARLVEWWKRPDYIVNDDLYFVGWP